MTPTLVDASTIATQITDRLATPDQGRIWPGGRWWPQSLAHGALGVALLHIERARTGHGPWSRAQSWLECAIADGVDASPQAHLYYGAPALAFVMRQAATVHPRLERELAPVDAAVARIVAQRLERAHTRMDAGERHAMLAEFDAIRGLAGLAALLLTHDSYQDLLRRVLVYLVRLTEPATAGGRTLPGWWTPVDPGGKKSARFPGGHANTGMAHGICGPLMVLAVALHRGIEVEGHTQAIERILDWLDSWQRTGVEGVWWPYWITEAQRRSREEPVGPQRPSWCYGTAGVAHAQLLAAEALGDVHRRESMRTALAHTLTPQNVSGTIVDASLCHGYAGLAVVGHTTGTAPASPLLASIVEGHDPGSSVDRLLTHAGIGLLEGAAGTAAALHTLTTPPRSMRWASFLLIGHAKDHAYA